MLRWTNRFLPFTVTQLVVVALFGVLVFRPTLSRTGLPSAQTRAIPGGVVSTPMEACLEALLVRFPNQVVIGFEELWDDERPDTEPQLDLGPPNASLEQVLERIRQLNPAYRVKLQGARTGSRLPRAWYG
jgi:hypothetical protein